MKAVLCKEYGPPERLVLEDIATPIPGPGQVTISVKACGVSFPDTLIIQGKYQVKPPIPFSPGSEVAGIVKALGAGVEHVNIGDRVIAFSGYGGFAEEVIADAARLIPIPAQMDFATAAIFVMNYGTSHHALKDRAQLQKGETLLVLGAAGGVGLTALEIGKLMGARVIAAASTAEKLTVCQRYGADEIINYTTEDLKERIKALTGGQGVDVTFDPVGGAYSEAAFRGMAWGGRHLVIGFAAGDIPRIPSNLALLKGCSLVGVFWGTFTAREPERNAAHLQELLSWYAAGKLHPYISKTYSLEQASQALEEVMQRNVKGKVVLLVNEG